MLILPLLKLLHSIENPGTDNRGRKKTKRGEMQVDLSNFRKGDVKGWISFTKFTYYTPAWKRFKSLAKPSKIK
jgi:hypothetical protein